jgi:hypothetical protein
LLLPAIFPDHQYDKKSRHNQIDPKPDINQLRTFARLPLLQLQMNRFPLLGRQLR